MSPKSSQAFIWSLLCRGEGRSHPEMGTLGWLGALTCLGTLPLLLGWISPSMGTAAFQDCGSAVPGMVFNPQTWIWGEEFPRSSCATAIRGGGCAPSQSLLPKIRREWQLWGDPPLSHPQNPLQHLSLHPSHQCPPSQGNKPGVFQVSLFLLCIFYYLFFIILCSFPENF